MDVEDLSGSLNLGNNFGVETNRADSSKKAKEKKKKVQKKVKKLLEDVEKPGGRRSKDSFVAIETTDSEDMQY